MFRSQSLAGVYYYSMALVVMGGLIVSTFLTTLLLPTTIAITEDTLGWLAGVPRRFARSSARAIRRRAAVCPDPCYPYAPASGDAKP